MEEKMKELLEDVGSLVEGTKKLHAELKDKETAWDKQLGELRQSIEAMHKEGASGPSKDEIKQVIKDVMNKQQIEYMGDRLLHAGEAHGMKVPDPWLRGASMLEPDDIKSVVEKGLPGLQLAVELPVHSEVHKMWSRMATNVWILDAIGRASAQIKGDTNYTFARTFPSVAKKWNWYCDRFIQATTGKAASDLMDTTDLSNWIPTGYSAELRELIMLQLRVAALFQRFTMVRPTVESPIDLGDDIAHFMPEQTDAISPYTDASTKSNLVSFTDTKASFVAKKLRSLVAITSEVEEDTIVPMLPLINRKIVKMLAKAQEKGTIDGQASGTIDTGDAPGTYDCRKAWDGLRYVANANSAEVNVAGSISTTVLNNLCKTSGEQTTDIDSSAFIISINSMVDLMTDTKIVTADVYGPKATIFTGEIAKVFGRPVIPSRYVRTDLNASGIYDGVTTTKTIAILVNTEAWLYGDRREVTLENERVPITDQRYLIATQRVAFKHLYGSKKTTVVGYNITN